MENIGKYTGKATKLGNSKGYRMDANLFKDHPEFENEVQVTIISKGQALLSVNPSAMKVRKEKNDEDPILLGFLDFLENQMATKPSDFFPANQAQLKRIAKLVKGVKVN